MTITVAKSNQRQDFAERNIARYYSALQQAYGQQHWWPASSRFEVILGTFLTQNTNWRNVELALKNLRRERALSWNHVRDMREADLAKLIRPAGYFRQKAKRIKNFVRFVEAEFGGSLDRLFARPLGELRERLLALKGIGCETADSILLYAGNKPVFVVDAYTRRVLERHGLTDPGADYDEIRAAMQKALAGQNFSAAPEKNLGHKPTIISRGKRSPVAQHYNQFHGLLVRLGKQHCRKNVTLCAGCPLEQFLPASKVRAGAALPQATPVGYR